MDRAAIEAAIVHLDAIMSSPDSVESDFQKWLERHVIYFELLGYERVLVHPQLTENGILLFCPDFMCQRVDGLWEIFEIKRADTEVLKDGKSRKSFYAEMESYISQTGQDYSKYFNDKQHRMEFDAKYSTSVQEQPTSILVAGRSHALDRQAVHRLLSGRVPSVTIQTYDDVARRLEMQRHKSFGGFENLPGFSIHLILLLEQTDDGCGTCVIDLGSSSDSANRVLLATDPLGNLVFTVFDRHQGRHVATVMRGPTTFDYGETLYLRLEVGGSSERAMMLAELNGRFCSEARISNLELQIEHPMVVSIGTDIAGVLPASMRLSDVIVYTRTLQFHESLALGQYLYSKYDRCFAGLATKPLGFEYIGRKFMYTEGHPTLSASGDLRPRTSNMIQPMFEYRPVLRGEE